MENSDFDTQGAHKHHVVLDHDDRVIIGDILQKFSGFSGFGIRHAGSRLVHEKQLRILGQQHADLQPLLLTVAEVGCELASLRTKPDQIKQIFNPLLLTTRNDMKQGGEWATRCLERQFQVVPDGMALKNGRFLKLAADPELGD